MAKMKTDPTVNLYIEETAVVAEPPPVSEGILQPISLGALAGSLDEAPSKPVFHALVRLLHSLRPFTQQLLESGSGSSRPFPQPSKGRH
jgi:hypothetical protein